MTPDESPCADCQQHEKGQADNNEVEKVKQVVDSVAHVALHLELQKRELKTWYRTGGSCQAENIG